MEETIKVIVESIPCDISGLLLGICSLIVAIAAVVISLVSAHGQKIHNVQSVCPIIDVIAGNYVDKIYVKLVNNGIGPAKIKKLKCLYQGSITLDTRESDALIDLLSDKKSPTSRIELYDNYVENISNRTIPPNGEITLVCLSKGMLDSDSDIDIDLIALKLVLKDIEIQVEYEDMYSNKKSSSRKLTLFNDVMQ